MSTPLRLRNTPSREGAPQAKGSLKTGDKAWKQQYTWCAEAGMRGLALSAHVPLQQSWGAVTDQGASKAWNTSCLGLERRHLPNSTWTEQYDRLVWLWPSKQHGVVRDEIRVEAADRLQRHLRPTEVAGILKAFYSALPTSAAPSYSWLLSIWSVAWAAVTWNFTFPFS